MSTNKTLKEEEKTRQLAIERFDKIITKLDRKILDFESKLSDLKEKRMLKVSRQNDLVDESQMYNYFTRNGTEPIDANKDN